MDSVKEVLGQSIN